jgi:dipeptidyl-peptidase 4
MASSDSLREKAFMRTRKIALLLVLLCPILSSGAQGDKGAPDRLTVDRIFKDNEFRAEVAPSVQWSTDGTAYYDSRSDGKGGSEIVRVDILTGKATVVVDAATLVDESKKPINVEGLIVSADGTRALVYHNSVRVWRQNTKGYYHLVDFGSKRVAPISSKPGLQMFAKLSPSGQHVAFVRDNNLFVTDLTNMKEKSLTNDGGANIINGTSDWVYEEEFGLRDGFRWSPDGTRIAYWRFDQTEIPSFPVVDELGWYPRVDWLRYPKAGYQNSVVRLGVADIGSGRTTWLHTGNDPGAYFPRMDWIDLETVAFQRLPRKQNHVDLLLAEAKTGKSRRIMYDDDSAYVDVEDVVWLKGGKEFLWLSDRSGWRQVYLYDRSGSMVRQLTPDGSDILSIIGVDEKAGLVYVQAAAPTATQRHVFAYAISGRTGGQITDTEGTHTLDLSPGGRYGIATHSAFGQPPTVTVMDLTENKVVRTITDNAPLRTKLAALKLRAPEVIKILAADGTTELDAMRIVPPDFDSTKRYPVLMYVYGGPATPNVVEQWGNGNRYLWHQMLAQRGYVVISVDNRGAAWRGRTFRKMTQFHLGLAESDDQIAAAKWIAARSWCDPKRIGIWGWSYGGFLTLMSTTRGGDVFRMGISVAPVTDWKLYDTIYTERFMWIPQENADAYAKSSPLTYADSLKAQLLLVHGTGDDNVHPQHTTQFVSKLQHARKPFDMMLYPNKTHSISGAGATLHLYDTFTRYILSNL